MTPMMQQYKRFKREHQDSILLFRMGDFYEMFFEDAKTASKVLGLTLTSRSKGEGAIPMAGVPHHAINSYIHKLILAGYRVAVCDQVQDPSEAKGLVDRDVTQIITPGTVTDDAILDEKSNNYLCAVFPNRKDLGLAWVDLSTGKFQAEDLAKGKLLDELSRIKPKELLVPEELTFQSSPLLDELQKALVVAVTPRPDWVFDRTTAMKKLLEHFGVTSLEGFGCQGLGDAVRSAGAIIDYLQETQKTSLGHIAKLEAFQSSHFVLLDRSTHYGLELTETMQTRQKKGSLLWVLDGTVTGMGGRLLRNWALYPLRRAEDINWRQEGVAELVSERKLRERVRETLKQVQDIERIASRVSCRRANARDLLALKQSAAALPQLAAALADCSAPILKALAERLDTLDDIRALIEDSIALDPPIGLRDGGLIRAGHDQALDELRSIGRDGKSWLANFQAREAERAGIPSLKVGFNKVFGYYIEITHVHQERVPEDYIRKQTLKNAERYITPELKEYESKVLTAEDEAKELEYKIFLAVRDEVGRHLDRMQQSADVVGHADALASLAEVAARNGYTRPEIADDLLISVTDGRHPVLELILEDEEFVPNDVLLDDEANRMIIITGPNMAGKSTYIRQVALLVLMAQMGSFIPAKRAHIGVVDRVFTRVGASDELASGRSTFMVEMNEAANILNNSTRRSLIVLDEVGRGTSTFDGVSIAWAVSEHIHEHLRARTLFATHYHELTELALLLPGVRNFNVAVREWKEEIIFLRKIVEGGTDKSYGIHVARLAGIPKDVIERAKQILANLENQALDADDKPSFAPPKKKRKKDEIQLTLFGSPHEATVERLRTLNVQEMTPIQALVKLEELQKEVLDREQGADEQVSE